MLLVKEAMHNLVCLQGKRTVSFQEFTSLILGLKFSSLLGFMGTQGKHFQIPGAIRDWIESVSHPCSPGLWGNSLTLISKLSSTLF